MRTSTLARAGAVLTASALALTLGAGSASASEDTSTTKTTIPGHAEAAAAKVDWNTAGLARSGRSDVSANFVANPDLTTFAFASKNQVLVGPTGNPILGTITVAPGNPGTPGGLGYSMTTNLKYYGTVKTAVPLYAGFATKEPFGGTPIPDTYGPGLYSFGPTSIADPGGGSPYVDPTLSNTVRVRNDTMGDILYTKYIGSRKHKVTIHAQVYRPSANVYAGGISSVRLQYKSGSTWKTYKSISLSKYGKASYTWYSGKHTYRVLIPTTLSIQGKSDSGYYF
ncbi:hypothetical protein ASE12_09930 [Aeromicrobium sp. Root236]|uniref:hypothetical protein n=1 Tax=Aeromicrobium sp. Root236 TaxID=1736498 RepID=UPI000701841F|nr:hypothetical protein [Aeromicrobium sp. Root236]KRC65053.1 hypothetical protein ASE12_09930 [Aeromicrobium sp. Root236]